MNVYFYISKTLRFIITWMECSRDGHRPDVVIKQVTPQSIPTSMGEPDIDAATERVHEAIRALLADEIPDLADFQGFKVVTRKSGLLNNLRGIFKIQKKDQGEAELDPYLQLSWKNFTLYLTNLAQTWWDVFKSFGMMFLWKICKWALLLVLVSFSLWCY